MKLSMLVSYSGDPVRIAQEVADYERAGLDMAWAAEAYSFDAVSFLGYLAARTERIELGSGILPIYSRTPALLASTAAGLDAVSGGRFSLGLGASGPQVIEGWHGVPYDRPVTRTRELIEICRLVWRRERLDYEGEAYTLPLPPGEGTGLGRALKLINEPVRPHIPIWVAALGPVNVAMAAEVADGWLPLLFHPDKAEDVWRADLVRGASARSDDLGPLQISAGGALAITDDVDEARRIRDRGRAEVALYVGGMGAPGRNFYNSLFQRYGYEQAAADIQEHYLAGRRDEAAALVPDDFLQSTALVGDAGWVRDRVEAYRRAGVTHLQVSPVGADRMGDVARVRDWLG